MATQRIQPQSYGALIASMVAHAGLVVICTSAPDGMWQSNREDSFVSSALRYILPPLPQTQGARAEYVQYVELGSGAPLAASGVPSTVARRSAAEPMDYQVPGDAGTDSTPTVSSLESAAADQYAMTVDAVDSAAVRDPSSAGPDYPASLQLKGVDGYASMRFVVDTTGVIDPASIEVLDASHPEFAKAVRDGMPRMRFKPARYGQQAVRQMSEQRFTFKLTPPSPSGTRR